MCFMHLIFILRREPELQEIVKKSKTPTKFTYGLCHIHFGTKQEILKISLTLESSLFSESCGGTMEKQSIASLL